MPPALTTHRAMQRLVSTNLVALRRQHQLTQAQAAARWNAKLSTYAAWEQYRACPKMANMRFGCQHFGLTLDTFLTTKL